MDNDILAKEAAILEELGTKLSCFSKDRGNLIPMLQMVQEGCKIPAASGYFNGWGLSWPAAFGSLRSASFYNQNDSS